jgi:hypothetical protein
MSRKRFDVDHRIDRNPPRAVSWRVSWHLSLVGHTGEASQLWRTPIDSSVELRHLSAIDRDILLADVVGPITQKESQRSSSILERGGTSSRERVHACLCD